MPNIFYNWGRLHSSLCSATRSCPLGAARPPPRSRQHGTQCPRWSPWVMHHPSRALRHAWVLEARLVSLEAECSISPDPIVMRGWPFAASQLIGPCLHRLGEVFLSQSHLSLSAPFSFFGSAGSGLVGWGGWGARGGDFGGGEESLEWADFPSAPLPGWSSISSIKLFWGFLRIPISSGRFSGDGGLLNASNSSKESVKSTKPSSSSSSFSSSSSSSPSSSP